MGSLVLQAMMEFNPQSAAILLHSFQSLDPEFICQLAMDTAGSRVLEAYIANGPASLKEKKKFLFKLEGRFTDLGCEPSSSFFVEKCYQSGDLQVKTLIAQELANGERKLGVSKCGKALLFKCKISLFKRQPKVWEEQEKNISNRINSLNEFSAFLQSQADSASSKTKVKPSATDDIKDSSFSCELNVAIKSSTLITSEEKQKLEQDVSQLMQIIGAPNAISDKETERQSKKQRRSQEDESATKTTSKKSKHLKTL
jgi:hypothetical protein